MDAHVEECHGKETSFAFEKTPRIGLSCKLVSVQYQNLMHTHTQSGNSLRARNQAN